MHDCCGRVRTFGTEYAHDVHNVSQAPAVSIHASSPPLREMNEYELDDGRLVRRESDPRGGDWRFRAHEDETAVGGGRSIEQVLDEARWTLRRLSPEAAYDERIGSGALLVDIRPERQREMEGQFQER